jgi:hypothetical protein
MTVSRQQQDEQARAYGRIVAKAWGDEAFKQRLLADPVSVLAAEGLIVPRGSEVRVVENTDKLVYFMLPARPAGADLSDEQLSQVDGGGPNHVSYTVTPSFYPGNP